MKDGPLMKIERQMYEKNVAVRKKDYLRMTIPVVEENVGTDGIIS